MQEIIAQIKPGEIWRHYKNKEYRKEMNKPVDLFSSS